VTLRRWPYESNHEFKQGTVQENSCLDPVHGNGGATIAENAGTAALREAVEETGIDKQLLEKAKVIPVGNRSYHRPFDIRVAWGDMPGTDIKKGDFFAVSTQAFRVKTNTRSIASVPEGRRRRRGGSCCKDIQFDCQPIWNCRPSAHDIGY
jgi:hypothetical protein